MYGVLAFRLISPEVIYSGDMGVKFVQSRALFESGFRSLSIPYRGAFLDPTGAFRPFRAPFVLATPDGMQAIFPPAGAVLEAPFAGLGGLYGMRLLSILAAAAVLLCAIRLGSRDAAPILVLILGLGTPLWFFGTTEWEHAPAMAFSTAAFVGGLRRGTPAAFLCGTLLGAAASLRDESALLIVGLVTLVWIADRSYRRVAACVCGLAAVLLAAAAVEVWWFQRPPAAHLQHAVHLLRAAFHLTSAPNPELPVLAPLTLVQRYQTVVEYWLLGVSGIPALLLMAATAGAVLARQCRAPRLALVFVAAVAIPALRETIVIVNGPRFVAGLFGSAPFLLFALLPGAPLDAAAGRFRRVAMVTAVSYLVLAFMAVDTTGGKGLGARLLLPLLPLLAAASVSVILALLRASEPWERRTGLVGVLLLCAAVTLHAGGTMRAWVTASAGKADQLAKATAADAGVFVADDMYTAQLLLPFYFRRIVLLADTDEKGAALGALLVREHIASVVLVSQSSAPRTSLPPLQPRAMYGRYGYDIEIWRR